MSSNADLCSDPQRSSRADPSADVALGFDLPDDDWLKLVGVYQRAGSLGSLGEYDLEAEIGRGGQGVVYRAVQPRTGRTVAIKRVPADVSGSSDLQERFDREVRAAAALNHPNIVTVYGSEKIDGTLLLAMEYIEGVPVHRWAAGDPDLSGTDSQRRPPQTASQILRLFVKICDAVAHAHQRGVIHRDLKPSNVLVDKVGEPHVLDFGLARVFSPGDQTVNLTRTAGFVGTPAFASPEQFGEGDGQVDLRSDVYSIGCMLYQALTGCLPHGDGFGLADIVEALRHRDPALPSSLRHELNREIDAIALKALAKRKEERYQSVDALADDIRRYLDGQAVLAHPPTAIYQFRKLMRRKRGLVLGAAAFLLLLAASSIVSTALYVQAEAARGLALKSEQAAVREAQQQRDTANALLGIIQRITQHAAGRPSITIRRLAGWIAEPFQDSTLNLRPEVEFDLHMATAGLLQASHFSDEAAKQFRRSQELATATYGAESPQVFRALLGLSDALRGIKQYNEAEATARTALDSAIRRVGRASAEGAAALDLIAGLQLAQGAGSESERTMREIVGIRDQVGPSADYRASARHELARLLLDTGRYDESRAVLLEAQRILQQEPTHNPNWDAQIWMQLGWIESRQGRMAEAEPYFAQAVDYRTKRQGLEYFRTNQALRSHGHALFALGQYAKAADCFEKALVWQERARSADAVDLAALRFHLAAALLANGRAEEGRTRLLQAVSRGKASKPGDAKFDETADRVEAKLRENGWRIDSALRTSFGKLSWLIAAVSDEPAAERESPPADESQLQEPAAHIDSSHPPDDPS